MLTFFSYGCGHCRAFEPALESWARQRPADVELRRVPLPFLTNAEVLQRCFFALQTLGLLNAVHAKLFAVVQDGRSRLADASSAAAFLMNSNLVPPEAAGRFVPEFTAAFDSFSTAASVGRARALTWQCGIATGPGVPSVVVAGRWLTSPGLAGGGPQALAVVDSLLARARTDARRYSDKPSV